MKQHRINIPIPADLHAVAKTHCKKIGKLLVWYVRDAVRRALVEDGENPPAVASDERGNRHFRSEGVQTPPEPVASILEPAGASEQAPQTTGEPL